MSDYAELARLAAAATPGPWVAEDRGRGEGAASFGRFSVVGEGRGYPAADLVGIRAEADAAYIAAASPDVVLRLLARRAPGDRDRVEALRIPESDPDHTTRYGHGWNDAIRAAARALAADSPESDR